jgi:hypothetical protein
MRITEEDKKRLFIRWRVNSSLRPDDRAYSAKTVELYIFEADNGLIKIGKALHALERLDNLNAASPIEIRLVARFRVPNALAYKLEHICHAELAEHLARGKEWFRISTVEAYELVAAVIRANLPPKYWPTED